MSTVPVEAELDYLDFPIPCDVEQCVAHHEQPAAYVEFAICGCVQLCCDACADKIVHWQRRHAGLLLVVKCFQCGTVTHDTTSTDFLKLVRL